MLSREQLKFILQVTDYFHGHYEDPEWGRRLDQMAKKLNVYIAASEIEDKEVRTTVQGCLEKNLSDSIRHVR